MTIAGFVIIIFLFDTCRTRVPEPKRLSNIPREATWYGGKDGGCWITFEKIKKDKSFHLKIYNENTGEVEANGNYKLNKECFNLPFDSVDVVKNIIGYDGFKVLLSVTQGKNNCYLERLLSE